MDRKSTLPGERRQRVAIGRMQPLGAAVERKFGGRDRMDAAADPAARLEDQYRDGACFDKTARRADPGGAGTDHRDVNLRSKSHLCPRCAAPGPELPSADRGGEPPLRARGDLADQLAGDRVGKRLKILDDAEKGAGAADDVLAIPFGQSPRRLGMKSIAGIGL